MIHLIKFKKIIIEKKIFTLRKLAGPSDECLHGAEDLSDSLGHISVAVIESHEQQRGECVARSHESPVQTGKHESGTHRISIRL